MIEKEKRNMGTVSIIEDCQLNEVRIYQDRDSGNKDTQHHTSFEGYLEGAVCSIEIEGGVSRESNSLQLVALHEGVIVPIRGTKDSAGLDIRADDDIMIPAGSRAIIPTGLKMRPPVGTYIRIAPRSGLSVKHSIDVGAAVVDRDYIGESKVVLCNNGQKDFEVKRGDHIA